MKNKSLAILDLGFGDSGKGITTDYLCSQTENPLVVRFNGGQQAGHTVYANGKNHVFANFGSGTLGGVTTYWSKYCTVEPIGLMNELQILFSKDVKPLLFIDERCPITTPYDMHYNQTDKANIDNGTCGVGVGATIQREENNYHLTFGDLFTPFVFKTKVEMIKQYYSKITALDINCISLDRFFECVEKVNSANSIHCCYNLPLTYQTLIFEGGQGLLLDKEIGFFPHVTRSNCGTKNIIEMGYKPELYLVTRAYQTRHGNGIMSNEHIPFKIKDNPFESNITNQYQGTFRKSMLDLDLLFYGIYKDDYIRKTMMKKIHKVNLVITCIDNLEEYKFSYQGKIYSFDNKNQFIGNIRQLLGIENLYISESPYSDKIEQVL